MMKFSFNIIFNKVKKINLFKKHILGLEFVEGGLKLAILEQTKKEKRIICLEFFSGSNEEIKKDLKEFIRKKNLRYQEIKACISRHIVSLRYLNLPSVNPQEIETMIPFQLRRLFPYGAEEVEFSFEVLYTDAQGFSRVMLFVAQKDKIEDIVNILEELKIRPLVLTISSWGLFNWYLNQKKKPEVDTVAILDINRNFLEFIVVYQDKLVFSRTALLIDKSKITDEIKICFDVYNKELNIASIKNLILVGTDTDFLNAIAKELTEFKDINIEFYKPWQDIDKIGGKQAEFNWTSIWGLLFQVRPSQINLLPLRIKQERGNKIRLRSRNKTIFISLVVLLLVFLNIARHIYYRSNILKGINTKLTALNPDVERLSDMQRKIYFVNRELRQRFLSIEILKELYQITPEGISFNTFIYEKDSQVVLKGVAEQMSLVFNYIPILEKSGFLKNAQVRFATTRVIANRELTDFEIICLLEEII